MGRPRKYATEEERKEAVRASIRKWQEEHKAEIAEYHVRYNKEHKKEKAEYDARYRQEHKDKLNEYMAKYHTKYYNTKEGRASMRIRDYKREDKKYNRGDCDLRIPWFVRNIFTKCIYCGETDWKKLGADRIDNNLPHTMENVVPCCAECNWKRGSKPFEQFCREMNVPTTVNFS